MSVRSLRTKERIDFRIYNKTGRKVPKGAPELVPQAYSEMANLVETESKLVGKIERFLAANELSQLIDESDIREAISDVRSLNEEYIEIHYTLKTELDADYPGTYPGYDDQLKTMSDYIKSAIGEIKSRREAASKADLVKIQNKLKAEEKFFQDRIEHEISSFKETVSLLKT